MEYSREEKKAKRLKKWFVINHLQGVEVVEGSGRIIAHKSNYNGFIAIVCKEFTNKQIEKFLNKKGA